MHQFINASSIADNYFVIVADGNHQRYDVGGVREEQEAAREVYIEADSATGEAYAMWAKGGGINNINTGSGNGNDTVTVLGDIIGSETADGHFYSNRIFTGDGADTIHVAGNLDGVYINGLDYNSFLPIFAQRRDVAPNGTGQWVQMSMTNWISVSLEVDHTVTTISFYFRAGSNTPNTLNNTATARNVPFFSFTVVRK